MKNFKKVVAAAAAVAMTMSIGVSAFAEATATASYADGKVNVKGVTMDNDKQYTVIVIAADKANKTLDAADLYYINQGKNDEAFWKSGLGVKEDLKAGNYIARIGGEDLAQVIEIPFTVGATGEIHMYGDVDDNGKIQTADALQILYYINESEDFLYWDEFDEDDASFFAWKAMDIKDPFDEDTTESVEDITINTGDALEILYYINEADESILWDIEDEAGSLEFTK